MVLDKLSSGLQGVLGKIRGSGVVDKQTVKEIVKEIQKTLISADVRIEQVFELSKRIEEKALTEKLPTGISRKEHLIKVVYEEITALMGSEEAKFELDPKKQNCIILVGVQGSGKTTQAAKLAKYLIKKGFKPGMICADKFRPGALDQLRQLGEEINVPVYGEPDEKKPWNIAKHGLEKLKDRNVVIIDSEGRHSLDKILMDEIEHLEKDVKPAYTILVLDSTIGQQAETQALAFKEKCNVNGIILTKLDGSAKGGGGISACAAAQAPIFFIGVGERVGDFERFDPKAFVGRLMGFGDVKGLLQKFEEHVEKDQAEDMAKRMMSGKFTLLDVYQQLEQVKKMGPLSKVAEMLPGFGGAMAKMPKDMMNVQEERLKKFKPIMQSMTPEELENPKLSSARVERIAKGSGTKPEDVRALVQQYNQMRAAFKKLRKDRRFARMFKGMGDEIAG
jgi:signal recognition particle subunit SRP54